MMNEAEDKGGEELSDQAFEEYFQNAEEATLNAEPEPAPEAEAEAAPAPEQEAAPEPEQGEERPPKSAEEYQSQIDNLNKALREARGEGQKYGEAYQKLLEAAAQRGLSPNGEVQPKRQDQPRDIYAELRAAREAGDYARQVEIQTEIAEQQYEQRLQSEQQTQEQEREAQAWNAVRQAVTPFEQEFRASTPDYDAALGHLLSQMAHDNAVQFDMDERTAANAALQQALRFAHAEMRAGRNPAEWAYRRAQQFGYQAPRAETEPTSPPAPAADPERLNGAKAMTRSLSSSGTPARLPSSVKELAAQMDGMSNEEFNRVADTLFGFET